MVYDIMDIVLKQNNNEVNGSRPVVVECEGHDDQFFDTNAAIHPEFVSANQTVD